MAKRKKNSEPSTVTKRTTQKPDHKRFVGYLDRIVSGLSTRWTRLDQICAKAGL